MSRNRQASWAYAPSPDPKVQARAERLAEAVRDEIDCDQRTAEGLVDAVLVALSAFGDSLDAPTDGAFPERTREAVELHGPALPGAEASGCSGKPAHHSNAGNAKCAKALARVFPRPTENEVQYGVAFVGAGRIKVNMATRFDDEVTVVGVNLSRKEALEFAAQLTREAARR